MKTCLLALLSVSVIASAQTKDFRLQKLNDTNSAILPVVSVSVLADGTVERTTFLKMSRRLPVTDVVSHLSNKEMDSINSLVRVARLGKVVLDSQHAACFRAPDYTAKETADNGKVFLYSGNVCIPSQRNVSPAAAKLRNLIEGLYSKYSTNN